MRKLFQKKTSYFSYPKMARKRFSLYTSVFNDNIHTMVLYMLISDVLVGSIRIVSTLLFLLPKNKKKTKFRIIFSKQYYKIISQVILSTNLGNFCAPRWAFFWWKLSPPLKEHFQEYFSRNLLWKNRPFFLHPHMSTFWSLFVNFFNFFLIFQTFFLDVRAYLQKFLFLPGIT